VLEDAEPFGATTPRARFCPLLNAGTAAPGVAVLRPYEGRREGNREGPFCVRPGTTLPVGRIVGQFFAQKI
jgi:hypothetical protein